VPQKLDTGETVAFGQSLGEVESLLSSKATDHPLLADRKGIEKVIKTQSLLLEFDSGRLKAIVFRDDYEFKNPPAPYPEPWKNLSAIGAKKIYPKMSRADFLSYLADWEQRAIDLGGEKTDSGDLTSRQFAILITRDRFIDMIHISLGPSRRGGGQSIWCDGWSLNFTIDLDIPSQKTTPGLLEFISAFRDEFNTIARTTVPSGPVFEED
jgi:hypothetical protein